MFIDLVIRTHFAGQILFPETDSSGQRLMQCRAAGGRGPWEGDWLGSQGRTTLGRERKGRLPHRPEVS